MQKNTTTTSKVKKIAKKVHYILFTAMLVYFIAFLIGVFGFKYDIMHMQPLMTVTVEECDEEELGGVTFEDSEEPCEVIRTNVGEDQ